LHGQIEGKGRIGMMSSLSEKERHNEKEKPPGYPHKKTKKGRGYEKKIGTQTPAMGERTGKSGSDRHGGRRDTAKSSLQTLHMAKGEEKKRDNGLACNWQSVAVVT